MERLSEIENELQSCSSVKEAVKILQGEIAQINRIVSEQGNRSEELRGMGATLVMLIICDSECAIMNIGDSRAYQFDGESLIQLTKDHTEGQRMLDLGLLSRKELAGFPARKNLTRYVGYDQEGYILRADEYYPVWKSGIILLCSDGVTDVRNFGAIARTCECAGVDAIIIPSKNSVSVNADAIKTSAGALHTLPVCRENNLTNTIRFLKESGFKIVAATEKGDYDYTKADYQGPTCIIMGAEDTGVPYEHLALCDEWIKIPLFGSIESLNVSVAAGILIYEAVKQRGFAPEE